MGRPRGTYLDTEKEHTVDTENRSHLDRAANAYVECACWTDEEQLPEDWQLTDEKGLTADLYAFLEDEAVARDVADLEPEQVGHDFWLTRNGHGAGFWDRGLGDVGERLTTAAKVYGAQDLGEFGTE
jgi:hypothetical protein